jgi:hypothetical protein
MARAGEVRAMLAAGVNPSDVARKPGDRSEQRLRAIRLRKIKRHPTTYGPA